METLKLQITINEVFAMKQYIIETETVFYAYKHPFEICIVIVCNDPGFWLKLESYLWLCNNFIQQSLFEYVWGA